MSYGLFGIRRWKPTKPVTVPAVARFEGNAALEAERRRAAFWRAIEGRRPKQPPVDFERLPV